MTERFGRMIRNSLLLLFVCLVPASADKAVPLRPEELAIVRQLEAEVTKLKLQLEIVRLRSCLALDIKLAECGQLTQDGTAITKIDLPKEAAPKKQ